ncbi:MAG: DUF4198 domain-containing protein [Bacteroidetes bacterium]|nr:DUF4198 domain-containing protein [Bacteroidota bacterium]
MSLINGTFDKSENIITRDRMTDVSIVLPDNSKIHPDTSQWRDSNNETVLDFKTAAPGTYVIGVSTFSKIIHLEAKDFNEYLKHDGILEVLELRKQNNELDKDVSERYSKHVKAILQAGDMQTSNYATQLGYPAEIVPLQNPYNLSENDIFKAQILKNGKRLVNQVVYASYEGYHRHHEEGSHDESVQTRSDQEGVVEFKLSGTGRWYIRFINMVQLKDSEINYESNWATLTFEIR